MGIGIQTDVIILRLAVVTNKTKQTADICIYDVRFYGSEYHMAFWDKIPCSLVGR
jgi:hypothetical protein